jgi:aminopeptidase-like protein
MSSEGLSMYSMIENLFPINRSLTGDGVRETLRYIRGFAQELKIYEVDSGTQVFDWIIPREWNVEEAYIEDLDGTRIIDFAENNLHLMGYSIPIEGIFTLEQLQGHLYSIEDQPEAIPYVTSYYEDVWGFCLTHNQRKRIGDGPFRVVIKSELKMGSMTYGELYLPGETTDEILLSTYICHPSMASNELSGPVVAVALVKWLKSLTTRKYSYRFLFLPETIGSIYYISQNLEDLKSRVKAGWVLTCLGDDRSYSYVPTRNGSTLTDKVSRRVLESRGFDYREYSFLDRGSDERQYCFPGVDLPMGSLMRSKYGEYPEYHTSLDNLNFVTPTGLQGGFEVIRDAIRILETTKYWKINTTCEPQLGKRGMYPNTSSKASGKMVFDQMNVITYLDGFHDVQDISIVCGISVNEVEEIIGRLLEAGLVY